MESLFLFRWARALHMGRGDGCSRRLRDDAKKVQLRPLLDDLFSQASDGRPLELEPLRRLVAALVKSSGRHTHHGLNAPKLGKHSCARGKEGCPHCRYGFPHDLLDRCGDRPFRLVKGDLQGSWHGRFPRNDRLCCSYEPHILLANLGNVDWRPCLNLWAVVEYVTKYATKAASGSRRIGEVLREAVAEVCKFSTENQGVDLLRKALQKFYSRTLGDRDFGVFEAVHLGLGLPLVLPLLPVVSLNTFGTRAVKPAAVVREQGQDEPLTYDSRLDKFDKRLALFRGCRNRGAGTSLLTELDFRDLSLYEFCYKYYVMGKRMGVSGTPVCLMVTPSFPANCADVTHVRHKDYARMCVVAFWRNMSTRRRRATILAATADKQTSAVDVRRIGSTTFEAPPSQDGGLLPARFLGVQDLILKFDHCLGLALMEMLVDPLLCTWAPA